MRPTTYPQWMQLSARLADFSETAGLTFSAGTSYHFTVTDYGFPIYGGTGNLYRRRRAAYRLRVAELRTTRSGK